MMLESHLLTDSREELSSRYKDFIFHNSLKMDLELEICEKNCNEEDFNLGQDLLESNNKILVESNLKSKKNNNENPLKTPSNLNVQEKLENNFSEDIYEKEKFPFNSDFNNSFINSHNNSFIDSSFCDNNPNINKLFKKSEEDKNSFSKNNSTNNQTRISFYLNKSNSDFLNKKREWNSETNYIGNKFIVKKGKDSSNISNQSSKKKKKSNRKIHDKFCSDNIIKKLESASFKFIINKLNSFLGKINKDNGDKMFLKIGNRKENKPSIDYYEKLMKQKLKEIISSPERISKIYDENKKNCNKLIIDYLYNIKDPKLLDIINFLDLKYEDFWKYFSFYSSYKDKIINGKKIIDEIYEDYFFLNEMMKEFLDFINQNLIEKEDDQYKEIINIFLENYIQFCLRKKKKKKEKE